MDELLQEFIAETRETLEALTGELLLWENDPSDRERLDSIFRFFHTVKGSCGFLDLPRFARLSHAAEDVLSDLREGTASASTELVSAVLAVVDKIAELTGALESGEPISDESDELLISTLRHAAAGEGAEGEPVPAASISSPLITGLREESDAKSSKPIISSPAATSSVADIEAETDGEEDEVTETVEANQVHRTIRIPLQLLDKLMNGVSDLVLARNEVSRQMRDQTNSSNLENAFERLSGCVAEMRDSISKTRMQRIDRLFSGLPRLVRDISNELGKKVNLVVDGNEVEIDREMIEMIRDPLTHIVRNAIDHGIESPEDRVNAGKNITGRLAISARQSGNQILLEIADDGRGIDVERLVNKAIVAKVVTASAARALSNKAKLELIFSPGLSTAEAVSKISGRGVGMDVVRSNIERIGGLVEVENDEGTGLIITLRVPLTLTIIAGLTVEAGGELFAIPRTVIQEILRETNENVRIDSAGGAEIASVRGKRMPHIRLESILGENEIEDETQTSRSIIIIHASSGLRYALNVARVIDHEELVIKPGTPLVMGAGIYAGMTLPNNGKPMLLLDTSGIADISGLAEIDLDVANDDNLIDDDAETLAKARASTALLFEDLQGRKRAIRLSVIDRVEDIETQQFSYLSHKMLVHVDGKIWPVIGMDAVPEAPLVNLLRLNDGESIVYFSINEVLDMLILSEEIVPVQGDGLIEGVTMLAGTQTELIDAYWLFAEYGQVATGGKRSSRPVCCIEESDDPWTKNILVPLVESAGYDVVYSKDDADLIIQTAEQSAHADDAEGKLLRLRQNIQTNADDDSIYRYDRMGLLTALQAKMSGGRA